MRYVVAFHSIVTRGGRACYVRVTGLYVLSCCTALDTSSLPAIKIWHDSCKNCIHWRHIFFQMGLVQLPHVVNVDYLIHINYSFLFVYNLQQNLQKLKSKLFYQKKTVANHHYLTISRYEIFGRYLFLLFWQRLNVKQHSLVCRTFFLHTQRQSLSKHKE